MSTSTPKRIYRYAVKRLPETPVETGQLDATDMESARAGVAKLLGCARLPDKSIIMDIAYIDAEGEEAWHYVHIMLGDQVQRAQERREFRRPIGDRRQSSDRASPAEIPPPDRSILIRMMSLHNEWLRDPETGERAYLSGMNLTGSDLNGRELSHAHLAGADLSMADLSGATLIGVNLSGANLQGANLKGANMENADLSDADLRDAVLLDANMKGVELWRANIKGAVIKAQILHNLFECRTK